MHYLLFTTTTCPKCPAVKKFVSENCTLKGEVLDDESPHFLILAEEFQVTEAPTFLVLDKDNIELFRANEIYEIEEYLKK